MVDPKFRIQDCGSTPVGSPCGESSAVDFIKVSYLQLRARSVMRVGRQANTSIGRFVRMYLRIDLWLPHSAWSPADKGRIGQVVPSSRWRWTKTTASGHSVGPT
jgi:hypothetical protein